MIYVFIGYDLEYVKTGAILILLGHNILLPDGRDAIFYSTHILPPPPQISFVYYVSLKSHVQHTRMHKVVVLLQGWGC